MNHEIAIQCLEEELTWLRPLLQNEVVRLRATYQLSLDEFRGLFISDEQVDAHLATIAHPTSADSHEKPLHSAAAHRAHLRAHRTPLNPWSRLAKALELTELHQDVVLLAAAMEHDLRYASIFAYLNNDIAQRWPTVDLAIRLLAPLHSPAEPYETLRINGSLFTRHILEFVESTLSKPSHRALGFRLAQPVWEFLLGIAPADPLSPGVFLRPAPARLWSDVLAPTRVCDELRRIIVPNSSHKHSLTLLSGRTGAGRLSSVEALCAERGHALLVIEPRRFTFNASVDAVGTTCALLAALYEAVVLIRCDGADTEQIDRLLDAFAQHAGLIFLAVPTERAADYLTRVDSHIPFATPALAIRRASWESICQSDGLPVEAADIDLLAERFQLNTGEINRAVRRASMFPVSSRDDRRAMLLESARFVAHAEFGGLARQVGMRVNFDDLILPDVTRARLETISAAIAHRALVFDKWGLGRTRAAKGLTILFSGPSGTGKTLAASAIATTIGLELHCIDLSGLVSKYIGETEKNLERVFGTAHGENCVLFFDEADALFGKRSEVKEAHDRFANIEIAYLLQRLESHVGVVILATNLSANIDDAFSRRMDFAVEFPVPDASLRLRLWRAALAPPAPLDDDVPLEFFAERFELTGGDIRTVATHAAFLAARNGCMIHTREIVQALDEQLIKQGKLRTAAQFGRYFEFVRGVSRTPPATCTAASQILASRSKERHSADGVGANANLVAHDQTSGIRTV